MRQQTQGFLRVAAAVWAGLAALPAVSAGQWTVAIRAMQNPIPPGQCTAIEIVVYDAAGAAPLRPDGRQLDWQDFELELVAQVPEAFSWADPRHRFLCAQAPVPSSAMVTAHYPGAHVQPHERVPGVDLRQSVVVGNIVPQGQPAVQPVGGSPAAQPPAPAPAPSSGVAAYGAQAYGTPVAPPATPAPAAAPPAPAPAPSSPQPPAEAEPAVKGLGGLFKKIGAHARQKAAEVTAETARGIAGGASSVVSTGLETGGGVVAGAAAEVANTARGGIGSVGRALTPIPLRGGSDSDNLAEVMAAGGAELRMLRFTGATDVLEPASRELVGRLAAALNATSGNFVVEGHVDPMPSPAESQQLSEHRAAAVKAALIRHGVAATRLRALGYGAAEPRPEVPPGGGAPSSARIVVVREPAPTPAPTQ